MLVRLVKGTTNISVRHFDFVVGLAFVLTALLLINYVCSQQNKIAEYVFSIYQNPSITSKLQTPILTPDIETLTINGKVILERESFLFSREVMASDSVGNKTDLVVFKHPLQAIFSTPITWLFLVLNVMGIMFLRSRLVECLKTQLQEMQSLEDWIHSPERQDHHTPLASNSKMADYISAMQAELVTAKRGKSRFDQELKESALLDPATRIGNRNFFTSHLEAILREEDSRGAVFLIQLKGCELVQNLYGEAQALTLLESVIESIKSRIFGIPDCFLSRRGEFELAVLTPGLFVDETEKLAERMLNNLTSLPLPIGVNKEEFCHFGISYFKNNRNQFQIMSEADMALRSAQLQGPSQWFMYDPGEVAKESAIGSLKWRTFLTQVIKNKSFIIFSQPVIDTRQNKVLHYEVLSKLQSNQGKLISPRIFLPMTEKCGLSSQLDLMVFEQVCELITYEDKSVSYSLNLSIEALLSETFRSDLFEILHKYPNVAAKVIIEISEYHIKSRLNELIPIISSFTDKGMRILVDKVGQYVVNAQYLKQCQISYIKLHRSIILDIDQKPENQIFVQSMKVLCEPLGISLFAVGVESLEEWQTLMKVGICGGQGHYFNEPVAQIASAMN